MPTELRDRLLPDRRHPRVPYGSEIAVRVPEWAALRARGLDLSYGGMSLELPQRLRVGDKLVFGLSLPDRGDVQVEAMVRNVVRVAAGRFRVGLEWVGILEEGDPDLETFVDSVADAVS